MKTISPPLFLVLLSSLGTSVLAEQTAGTASYYSWPQHSSKGYQYQDIAQDYSSERSAEVPKPRWVSALSNAWSSPDRTIDLASLGIDLGDVFDKLLSPAGIVNQFALSFVIQLMFITGYIVSGLH